MIQHKKKSWIFLCLLVFLGTQWAWCQDQLTDKLRTLPTYNEKAIASKSDWLLKEADDKAALYNDDDQYLVLSNGLISRKFSLNPNGASVVIKNLMNGESMLRSVKPEASVKVDDFELNVGGLVGQPVQNYLLPEWMDQLKADPRSLRLINFSYDRITPHFAWKKHLDWMPEDKPWPPAGIHLVMTYQSTLTTVKSLTIKNEEAKDPSYLEGLTVEVHYEMYDNIPLICKWLVISNDTKTRVELNSFTSEQVAFMEPQSSVGDLKEWLLPNITVETDYAFGGSMSSKSGLDKSYFWNSDPDYATQVNYNRLTPCFLTASPDIGPDVLLDPGQSFETYRTYLLFHRDHGRERSGLAQRQMYRTIAPWITENPILMHVRNADNESVKLAIDQCADVGFEMVIMTFGSGFNLEDTSETNIERMKMLSDYAKSKGIALGGYSLLASRSVGGGNDVVMPEGMKPRFGNSPCLQSDWGRDYFNKLYHFYQTTGMEVLEHDGSYPGDVCASTQHPGHRGLDDSQWKQFQEIRDFYRWCRGQGIYLNVPDWYFLNGSSKTGMGYRETNWSLPRKYQEIIERQNIYDGTWEKTPSMGWMFVPLVQYHGGGEAATIEPLKDHLDHYGQRLANLFGAGVQACYRGPRLYDTQETRNLVKSWVDFYKNHRAILDSDIIHVRRPDGQDFDGILHVNPQLEEKGLLMLYNPLEAAIHKTIGVNVYYTGLNKQAMVYHEGLDPENLIIDRDYTVEIPIDIPARSQTWYVFK